MLDKSIKFVKVDHLKGTSKAGNPYEFANITLSDGIESFKLPLDLSIVPTAKMFTRGEDVKVVIDLVKDDEGNFRKDNNQVVQIAVTDITSSKKAS